MSCSACKLIDYVNWRERGNLILGFVCLLTRVLLKRQKKLNEIPVRPAQVKVLKLGLQIDNALVETNIEALQYDTQLKEVACEKTAI